MAESVKSVTPEPLDVETRKIVNMMCDVKSIQDSCELAVSILLILFEFTGINTFVCQHHLNFSTPDFPTAIAIVAHFSLLT